MNYERNKKGAIFYETPCIFFGADFYVWLIQVFSRSCQLNFYVRRRLCF